MMSIYRLPHGQYGYRGHFINLPQDVASFTTSLPRHPNDLDIVIVRKQGSSETYHDFHVRKSVILGALQYLISNNVYFSNITINDHHLSLLPEDGYITIAQEVMLDCDDNTVTDSSDSFDNDILRTCVHIHLKHTPLLQKTL